MKLGKMAVFYEKIVQGIVQPDRTGHERVLQRKSVCFIPVMPLVLVKIILSFLANRKLRVVCGNATL